jgi:hypothetical protein
MPGDKNEEEWKYFFDTVTESICVASETSLYAEAEEAGENVESHAKKMRCFLFEYLEKERKRIFVLACEQYDGVAKKCGDGVESKVVLRLFLDGCPEAHCLFSLAQGDFSSLSDSDLDTLTKQWTSLRAAGTSVKSERL